MTTRETAKKVLIHRQWESEIVTTQFEIHSEQI